MLHYWTVIFGLYFMNGTTNRIMSMTKLAGNHSAPLPRPFLIFCRFRPLDGYSVLIIFKQMIVREIEGYCRVLSIATSGGCTFCAITICGLTWEYVDLMYLPCLEPHG